MTNTNELLALIDLLEDLLDRADLAELEVEAGELGILLRKPGQLTTSAVTVEPRPEGGSPAGAPGGRGEGRETGERRSSDSAGTDQSGADHAGSDRDPGAAQARAAGSVQSVGGGAAADEDTADTIHGHAVIAPLTGVFYGAPSPGAAPYVMVGSEVVVGQVIGLIEAMKLFNEIKSDAAGRVVRIHAADGALVRAKEPLIELEPS